MEIAKIANITKRDSPIAYRRTYTGSALVHVGANGSEERMVEFTLEQDAAGRVSIAARFLDSIDYPLVPALRALKHHVSRLYDEGLLN